MTKTLKLLMLLTATIPTVLQAQSAPTAPARDSGVVPMFQMQTLAAPALGLTTTTVPQAAAGDNNVFCGSGNMFYFYEEDADGNEVPGTRQYGCDHDD